MIDNKSDLEKFFSTNFNLINEYIDKKLSSLPTPIYTSVDIRESKDKFAPIDVNLYPAGFNNLCTLDLEKAGREFKNFIETQGKDYKKIGIYCESHTKNKGYLDHLAYLSKIILDEDYEVEIFSSDPTLFDEKKKLKLLSMSNFEVEINFQKLEECEYDFIIMNNDQSSPIDIDWTNFEIPVHPSPFLGWDKREKSVYFTYYHKVLLEFCEHFKLKADLLEASFESIEGVDFSTKDGLDHLGDKVDQLLNRLGGNAKIFVKASQGTYGMGISVVSSGDEIRSMNRKTRNKMDIGKNKKKFTSALIQEGVETIIKYDDMPAEITIYLVGGNSCGGFMRANSQRDSNANLNSRGMVFRRFCISELKENADYALKETAYSIIARLATWGAAEEIKGQTL